jgi:formate C-acetyltransferase
MVVEELLRQGTGVEEARESGISGCVETGAFGREAYILTGYFNTAKVLEVTLHNGFDARTRNQIGLATGDPRNFTSYGEFFAAFRRQLRHCIEIKIHGNNLIERMYAK